MTLGEALNIFEQQHGHRNSWSSEDWAWHDLLLKTLGMNNQGKDVGKDEGDSNGK